ncbi:MAG: hypothetical protein KJN81_00080 [Acidimicrobiia bacterium]|nr:hypothetical protein [Acidimicrobiia bacterium]NNL26804.1 hypothetical protein [Acidimicrobiia bacterium]
MKRSLLLIVVLAISLLATGCKVTGGGWITTQDGDKATFSFTYECDEGVARGQFTYHHRAEGVNVKGTFDVDSCIDEDAEEDVLYGLFATYAPQPAKLGDGGVAEIYIVDDGEPGTDDFFGIVLDDGVYDGYEESGTLGGGNIQTH